MPIDNQEVNRSLRNLKAVLRRTPVIVGQESARFFRRSFDKQGFEDGGLRRWTPRKNDRDPGRAILVKTGQTRDSIRVIYAGSRLVVVGTDLPHAKKLNEGGLVYVKPHTRVSKKGTRYQVKGYSYKLPERRFIGPSKTLERHLSRTIVNELLQALR